MRWPQRSCRVPPGFRPRSLGRRTQVRLGRSLRARPGFIPAFLAAVRSCRVPPGFRPRFLGRARPGFIPAFLAAVRSCRVPPGFRPRFLGRARPGFIPAFLAAVRSCRVPPGFRPRFLGRALPGFIPVFLAAVVLALPTWLYAEPDAAVQAAPDAPASDAPAPDAAPAAQEAAPIPPPEPNIWEELATPNQADLESARAQGFEPRPEGESPGSFLGGLLALGPGFLVHGAGHYYGGDTNSALTLLLAELTGLALMIGGELLADATHDQGDVDGARRMMSHAGALLFLGSWGADVMGSFTGAESFSPDTSRTQGSLFGLAYRFTNDPRTDFRHHMVTRLTLDNGRFFFKPSLDLEVYGRTRRIEGELGGRFLVGDDPQNHGYAGVRLRRIATPTHGLASQGGQLFTGFKAELGQALPTLRHVYVVGRLGVGLESYQLSVTPDESPGLFADTEFTDHYGYFEGGIALNTGQKTHLSALFLQDPTADVAPFSPETGLMELRLSHRYDEELDVDAAVTVGDGWAFWMGLGYSL